MRSGGEQDELALDGIVAALRRERALAAASRRIGMGKVAGERVLAGLRG